MGFGEERKREEREVNQNLKNRLLKRLSFLYGENQAPEITDRILNYIESHKEKRNRSVSGPFWTHKDIVLITYGDTIQSPGNVPLQSLRNFLQKHLPNEISMLHILPFFPWSSDDGFSITDFRCVKEELGTWDDIAALEEMYDLVVDLVLNHCSRENLWFVDYLSGKEELQDFFVEVDQSENLSKVTRPRSTPVLTGVRTRRGQKFVWATFSNDQIDLNYKNPDVLIEMLDILLFYFRQGARMVRLDAVAYLWKSIGTNCIHLPQTHEVVKLLRDVLEQVEPGALIMTETNVPHDENITYFGDGDEAHVIYQFSLPPLLLYTIFSANTSYLFKWIKRIEDMEIHKDCTFLNFTASHDGVGLRPLEGLIPESESKRLLDAMRDRGGYISTKRNQDGSESPYELNISLFDAFRDPHPSQNQWHFPMFILSQVFALTFKGIPAIYIHSLLATPNDYIGVERTGSTRAVNRRKWDRGELEGLLANHESETGRVFNSLKEVLKIRKNLLAFHPNGDQKTFDLGNSVLCIKRESPDKENVIYALFNFSSDSSRIDWSKMPTSLFGWDDLLKKSDVVLDESGLILPPYAVSWFQRSQW